MGVEPKTTLQDFSSFYRNIRHTVGVIYTHVQNMLHQQMKKTIQQFPILIDQVLG